MMNAAKSIEDVPCVLTPEESHLKSKELCQLAIDRTLLEEKKKTSAAAYKADIDDKDEKIKALVEQVHSGIELRPVECYERPDYEGNRVALVRTDTGAVVRYRPMHPTERQTALDIGDFQEAGEVSRPRSRKTPPESAH